MVASLTTGRPKYVDHEPMLGPGLWTPVAACRSLLELADEDAEAYAGYSAALKMPRDSEAEIQARTQAMQAAARRASEAPLRCLEACFDLVGAAEALAGRSNPNAASDVDVAALLGEAAGRGAAANVPDQLAVTGDPEFEGATTAGHRAARGHGGPALRGHTRSSPPASGAIRRRPVGQA